MQILERGKQAVITSFTYTNTAVSMLSGIMCFCAGLSITREELELAEEVEENCMKHITFVNDICSYDKEVMTAS
jgi:hypothetical protein